ncbi:MAG: hypothetical protein M3036_15980, partial [Bifidobacteriales bacterium]|nr:hypothetical protein [Bifidobacteriales bacterium]
AKTMRGNLEKLDGQIDANLGVDYTRLRAWRTEIGQATQQGGIPGGNMAQTYKATTGATQDFADRAGMRQDFDNLMSAEAELYQRRGNLDTGGDIPLTQKLANMQTGDDVYRAIVQGGQPEKLDAVRRNMHPDQWAEISADVIENMGRAKPGQGTAASDFSPETFLTNWNKLPARSKEIIAGDEMGALNDLAKSATAFRERGRAGNSSGTASHLMTGGTAAGLVTSPVATAATLTAGHLAGRGLASEAFAKMLAGKAPKLAERLLPRIVGQTGRSVQDIQEQQ